jgi:hypothetical protein
MRHDQRRKFKNQFTPWWFEESDGNSWDPLDSTQRRDDYSVFAALVVEVEFLAVAVTAEVAK